MSKEVVEKTFAEQIAAKKKRNRLITAIISCSIGLAIVATIVTLSIVKVDLKPSIITSPSSMYFNGNTSAKYDNYDDPIDIYDDFMTEFNQSFSISYLTGIFTGRLGGYDITEDHIESLPNTVTDSTYVTFYYKDKITLTKQDGKTYYSKYNSNYSIDFSEVTFALSSEDKVDNMTIYLKYNWKVSGSSTSKTYYAGITLKGNTYKLNEIYNNYFN